MRRTFADVLENNKVDIKKEYSRLYEMFYECINSKFSLYTIIDSFFEEIWFRRTCNSLKDFDDSYGFLFEKQPENFNIEYLINFCEYLYNIIYGFDPNGEIAFQGREKIHRLRIQLNKVIDLIEHTCIQNDKGLTILVPKSPQANLVSQCVSENLSYKILEYNHYSLIGNLDAKKSILLKIALELEPHRSLLKNIDTTLEKNLFVAFNNYNIRHNNCDSLDKNNFVPQFSNMKEKEQEEMYDWTYNQSLIAFLKLENNDLNTKFKDVKEKIDKKII